MAKRKVWMLRSGQAEAKKIYAYDPPYGFKYGSNFRSFVNKRDLMNRRNA